MPRTTCPSWSARALRASAVRRFLLLALVSCVLLSFLAIAPMTIAPMANASPDGVEAPVASGEASDLEQPGASASDDPFGELFRPSTEPKSSADLWSRGAGAATLRLVDLSTDLLFAVGGSSERDESLASLQGGGHDPRKRGFTLQNLELSLLGAVDPYFDLETHLIFFVDPLEGESVFELEEAFITSQMLPFGLERLGLQLEVGQMFAEFGRINPRHPHAWNWLDQPVIHARVFGPDGLRGPGARLGWLLPAPESVPFVSQFHFGVQNANGETMASFLANDEFFAERPIGGRGFNEREVRGFDDLVWVARLETSVEPGDDLTIIAGVSGLAGPNAAGGDTTTLVWGGDLLAEWRPAARTSWLRYIRWQSEVVGRRYEAEAFTDDTPTTFAATTLDDVGFYSELLVGVANEWATGLRYELACGSGPSVSAYASRAEDPFRDDRQRFAPVVIWTPTHFSRVRLQYNFDVAQHLEDDHAHSVWLGFEVLIGKHPAHSL